MGPNGSNTNGSACPSDVELRQFSRGRGGAAVADAIEQHVEQCARCAESVASLAEADTDAAGRIVHILRRSVRTPVADPYSSDPECVRMTQKAKRLFPIEDGATPAPAPGLALPFTLDDYELLELIGEGGMGTVYRGIHKRLSKPVAVKVLRGDRTTDPRAVARFQREMTAVGRLDHPNLVRATDAGVAAGVHFLVMELIDGVNLARLVGLTGRVGVADACAMIRQAALGLQAAHGVVVHRDIKPSNLLLNRRGELKILDLGLARLQDEGHAAEELTTNHQILGTGDYMAPEQWLGSHGVDSRADIYSLGCTFFFLLTGTAPYSGPGRRTPQQKMAAHLYAELPLAALNPSVPRGLRSLFERMLAKDAEERFTDPAELAAALTPFCAGADLPVLAQHSLAQVIQPDGLTRSAADSTGAGVNVTPRDYVIAVRQPKRRRTRRLFLTAAGLLLVLVAGVVAMPLIVPRNADLPQDPPQAAAPQPAVPPPDPPAAAPVGRAFKPGQWHELLDQAPREWDWYNPTGNSRHDFDPKLKRSFVQSAGTKLLVLGRATGPGFTVQVRFQQRPWTGGVGIFFAGRKDPATQALHFKVVELRRGPRPGTMIVHLGIGSIEPRPGSAPLTTERGIDSWMLPELPGPRDYGMEISVEPAGLSRVIWDNHLCDSLIDNVNRAAKGETYQGEFGLYCRSCSVQLTRADCFVSH